MTIHHPDGITTSQRAGGVPEVYADSTRRLCAIVRYDGVLYTMPRCQGAWGKREVLHLTRLQEAVRLRPAPAGVTATWLGVPTVQEGSNMHDGRPRVDVGDYCGEFEHQEATR